MARILVALPLLFLVSTTAAAPASAADAERGKQLFALCSQCHGETGAGDRLALAPAIAGLDAWYVEAQLHKFRSGGRGQHIDDVAGMRMRPMSLTLRSDEDIAAVSAYVASLPPQSAEPVVVGDAARGQTLYTPCGACHGVDGTGNQVMNGPRLDRASDWYLLESLEKFRAGVRGTSPKDPTGAIMRTMAMTLADEQALKDVVAHIMTLGE